MTVRERSWPILPVGADGGIQLESDALPRVTHTVDGVDLNVIWAEVEAVVKKWNANRSALSALLAFFHTNSADAIPQSSDLDKFEKATELGVPEALRPPSNYLLLATPSMTTTRRAVSRGERFGT